MSNAKAILALLRSRAEGDDDTFFSIALQVAAAEARQGRRTTAEELRTEIEKARARRSHGASVADSVRNSARRSGRSAGAARAALHAEGRRAERTLDCALRRYLAPAAPARLAARARQDAQPPSPVRRPARFRQNHVCRKRWRVSCICRCSSSAGRADYTLHGRDCCEVAFDFRRDGKASGVYLFDEFDAVGGQRTAVNDVAEMRRVLNSFLQFMEEGNSTDSVIICSTNHPSLLDRALLRRYDQVLEFDAPTQHKSSS